MAIKAIQLFSPDPGDPTDFTQVGAAQIFNSSVLPRTESLVGADAEQDARDVAEASKAAAPTPSRAPAPTGTAADLMRPERESLRSGGEIFGLQSSTTPGPVAGRPDGDFDPADFTFNREAQRDSQGRLRVYNPPSGDGGGAYEVAGITARYQPKDAARLRQMIGAGDHEGAEAYAKDFYRNRAAPFTRFTDNRGLQLQLADTVHHRGESGLRRVLQRATGSKSKDYGQLIQGLSDRQDALDVFHEARQGYEWDEVDRGRASRAKFRKGLQNRFNKAYNASKQWR